MLRKSIILIFITFLSVLTVVNVNKQRESGAPPYVAEDLEPPDTNPYSWIYNWTRPDGTPKVGLQVGHWKNNELPDELERLRGNTGASGGGKAEWEVNLQIAESTARILQEKGIQVEILPSTIPEEFWADAFVAIHADGNTDSSISGFKVAGPRRDYSEGSVELVKLVEEEYQKSTGLAIDPNVTRNMRGYYAFAWWRYDHAVHPRTPSVILETGFLTSPADRKIIVANHELSSQGLANGITRFLEGRGLVGI